MKTMQSPFKENGRVTAATSSPLTAGAAAILMMSREKADDLGLTPIVSIEGFGAGGLDPAYMGLGPVPAIKKVLKTTSLTIGDIEMIELNEAFAAQAIACMRELDIVKHMI